MLDKKDQRLNHIINIMIIGQELVYHLDKARGLSDIFKSHIKHHTEAVIKHFSKSIDKIFSLGDDEYKKLLLVILDVDSKLMSEISKLTITQKRELLEMFPAIKEEIIKKLSEVEKKD